MKKIFLFFPVVFFVSCINEIVHNEGDDSNDDTGYESLTLEDNSIELNIGDKYQLNLSYTPSNLPAPKCTYIAFSPGIANVDGNGQITALKEGRTKITVTPASGLNLMPVECTVTVNPALSERITLSETALNLITGDTKQLTFEIFPPETSNKEVKWESSNTEVVTVDNGLIAAISPGTAIVRVTAKDNSSSAECRITVSPPPVEGITITNDVSTITLMINETFQINEKVHPENAGNKNVSWSVDDNSVASISSTGLVTAKKIGTTTAKVTTAEGNFTATIPVKVTDISGFINAWKSGISIISTNGYVTGNVTSTIIITHKTAVVTVIKFEVVDNKTNQVLASKSDGLGILRLNERFSLTYNFRQVFEPDLTFKWYYTSNGKEYIASHNY
jgi:uncharacterized protein YjdB